MKTSRKINIDKIVSDCRKIAVDHIKNWKPSNEEWDVIQGAAYLRLSTDEQVLVEKGSLEQQVHLAISEADARSKQHRVNYKIVSFYIEAGISGQKEKRKEFITLKRNIQKGHYKFVVFKEIARIARDGLIWKQFFKLCQEKRCEVVIRGLPIDPNDPASILQLDILAAFAEYEAKVTSKRIRESVLSAMLNNGKFNSTHHVLGLDPVEINGRKQPGFYKPNTEELKIVTWIMEVFLRYGSHNKVLEECEKRGVLNKNGKPFGRHSLITLLTNPKYVGKWFLNPENEDSSQERLPAREQYHEIDLPHGQVVALDLWNKVQKKVSELAASTGKHKNGDNRIYPLSGGMLRYQDGSHFFGYSGNGNSKTSFYYRNKAHRFNIKAQVIEQDAVKVVGQIVKNSPEFQAAIKKYGSDVQDRIQFLQGQLAKLDVESSTIKSQKKEYLENLRMLLQNCTDSEEISAIKDGFKDHLLEVSSRQKSVEAQITAITRELQESKTSKFSWDDIGNQAERVFQIVSDNDPLALKNAYRVLFNEVTVGPEDKMGVRPVTYVLSQPHMDEYGARSEMVETPGVEPGSESNPPPESTCLGCVLDWISGVHKQTSQILRRPLFHS